MSRTLASIVTMLLGMSAGVVYALDATLWKVLHGWQVFLIGGLTGMAIHFTIGRVERPAPPADTKGEK